MFNWRYPASWSLARSLSLKSRTGPDAHNRNERPIFRTPGSPTPRNRQNNRLFCRRQPRQDRPNNQKRRAALRLLIVCLEGERSAAGLSPATGKTGLPVLPRASSPAPPANSPLCRTRCADFARPARILATCPSGRVIPLRFCLLPPSLRSDRRLLGSRSRAPAPHRDR